MLRGDPKILTDEPGDAKLQITVPGLAASLPQAEIAAHVPTSLWPKF